MIELLVYLLTLGSIGTIATLEFFRDLKHKTDTYKRNKRK